MSEVLLDILMITHNRPKYTALALQSLLDTCEPGMRVWVWHNGDDEATKRVLAKCEGHPHLWKVEFSSENRGLRDPTNWFWRNADAPFLAKVDDDCLLPAGWSQTLIDAHRSVPQLGIVACWLFYDEDFVPELAERKIRGFPGGHQVMLNCWVQGSGYVMKRAVFDELGPLRDKESFTGYGIRAALSGWTNGWYFPFVHIEHMDDPRSIYSALTGNDAFLRRRPTSAVNNDVQSLEEWKRRVRWMARSVQAASIDPLQYVGWRAMLRKAVKRCGRAAAWREPWRKHA